MNTATLSRQPIRTLALGPQRLLVIARRPGTRIKVLSGRVWMTEEGQSGDQFAVAGEELRTLRGGRSVIEALGSARVQVIEPTGSAARRVAQWLSALRRAPDTAAARVVALSLSLLLALGVPELLVRGMQPTSAGAAIAVAQTATLRG
ncbi:MAG: DUF2917 domain-containing protein [Pseudomonadota bacterium]